MIPTLPIKITKCRELTVELILSLLADAYANEAKLDKILDKLSEEVLNELVKELRKLEKKGKIDLSAKINLYNNPALYYELKSIERKQLARFVDYMWIASKVIGESMRDSYKRTTQTTYEIFGYPMTAAAPTVQITDTYITEKVLNIPWCQDGKTYSQRLYANVANFQKKLEFVLDEGITKGKGMDWMMDSWRKLTHSAAYDSARLLKTETVAMWSLATKESYLTMGIEYVEIVGDAECGGICVDYVGEPIPLREAELGDDLPPYHPNCACSYIAYIEEVPVDEEEI